MADPAPLSRRAWLTLGGAVGVGLVLQAALQRLGVPAQPLEPTPVVREALADPGSPAAGAERPEVLVVVFTDYQCGVCKRTDPALRRLLANEPRVRVVFKDWPVFGERSLAAARLALAAHRQGGYVALHAALMDARGPLDEPGLRRAVQAAGLEWESLQADLAQHGREIDAQLARHGRQAFSLGLAGTPAYLVGPYLIQGGLTDRDLAHAVRRARRAKPLE